MLEHIIERSRAAEHLHQIVVATSTLPQDDTVASLARDIGVEVFRGSADDVLQRYWAACEWCGAEIVVRLTGDNPFCEPALIDRAIRVLVKEGADYCSNKLQPTFPDGLDVEAFSAQALRRACAEAPLRSEREHVTPYIWKNPGHFSLADFLHDRNLSHLRWTVDYPPDLAFARAVYGHLYPRNPTFSMSDVLDCLGRYPELCALNSGIPRNEGYLASLTRESACLQNSEFSQLPCC